MHGNTTDESHRPDGIMQRELLMIKKTEAESDEPGYCIGATNRPDAIDCEYTCKDADFVCAYS